MIFNKNNFLNDIIKFIDFVDYIICKSVIYILRNLLKKNSKYPPKNIILLRHCFFGDFIVCIPSIKLLKIAFPNSNIIFLTSKTFNKNSLKYKLPKEIFKIDKSLFDEVIEYDSSYMFNIKNFLSLRKKLEKFNDVSVVHLCYSGQGLRLKLKRIILCFLLNIPSPLGNLKNKPLAFIHSFDRYRLKRKDIIHQYKASILSVSELIDKHYLNFDYKNNLETVFNNYRSKKRSPNKIKKIGIAPFSKSKIKEWDKVNFINVINSLSKKINFQLNIYGSSEDLADAKNIANSILIEKENIKLLCGCLAPDKLLSNISDLDLMICIDSAPMHIACLTSVEVIAIFSQLTLHQFWEPWGKNDIIISCKVKEKNSKLGFSLDTNLIKPEKVTRHALDKLIN